MREVIPQKFNPMIQIYKDSETDAVEIEFIPPSGQLWDMYDTKDRMQLGKITQALGQDLDGLVAKMKSMLPLK